MTWNRREVLAALGVASAQAMLACGAPAQSVRRRGEVNPEIRTWLREAVATLAGAGLERPHVLAVTRRRTAAGLDVLGTGVVRGACDGVVLSVRERGSERREQVTSELTRAGIQAATRVLAGKAKSKSIDFGFMPPIPVPPKPDPETMTDNALLERVVAMAGRDRVTSSRIVYSSAVIEIDDAHVWSIRPGRDVEQRLVRVRKSVTRVAWNGTRPIVSEAMRAWAGGVDEQELAEAELIAAREGALTLMTPRAFEDGEHAFVLAPEVAASMIDVAVQSLLTPAAARRPEVAKRLAGSISVAPALTLVDDPTAPGAYGGFRFDDEGEAAAPVKLVEQGRIVGRLDKGRALRPGHVGALERGASHLRLAPGTADADTLTDDGFILEGPLGTVVDPSSDRIVIAVARARERKGGHLTGRMFADVELVGELAKTLAAVSAVSRQVKQIGLRDEIDGQPRWRSIETPWLLGRGVVRARRRTS
ncbi:MAG: hypothetical protein HOV81_39605 [Kofleriaceae bacterium]|nr:hypothetical protein [Kofleriaceae bacterium]